jgi:hypothetical protein
MFRAGQNSPNYDENIVQFTNSTASRSSVASCGYLISDSLNGMTVGPRWRAA